ncbi:hypothetical protein ACLB2K_000222 [Fragaria x ananassa]
MDSNPSSILDATMKENNVFLQEPVSMKHPYYFAEIPACLRKVHPDSHLRYIKYETIEGVVDFGTIQVFESHHDADRHRETQQKYDATFFINPVKHLMHKGKHVTVFPKIITDFNGCWVKIHTDKDDDSLVTDEDIWTIFKKIGQNMKYLSSEATPHRPHGNLLKGTGITSDLLALFLNLGDDDTNPMIYKEDVEALHELLSSVTLTDKAIKEYVDSCVKVQPQFTISPRSAIHPPYQNHNHVRCIFNYPSCWGVKEQLRFLGNLYKLCSEKGKTNNQNLFKSAGFKSQLMKCKYTRWNHCFVSGTNKSPVLNEVYQFRPERYLDRSGPRLNYPTIVLFVGNWPHYGDGAETYNRRHGYQRGHMDYMEEFPTASRRDPCRDTKRISPCGRAFLSSLL